jgi:hypothetical protein
MAVLWYLGHGRFLAEIPSPAGSLVSIYNIGFPVEESTDDEE